MTPNLLIYRISVIIVFFCPFWKMKMLSLLPAGGLPWVKSKIFLRIQKIMIALSVQI